MRWPWQVWREDRRDARRYRWLLQLPAVREAIDAEYARQMVQACQLDATRPDAPALITNLRAS